MKTRSTTVASSLALTLLFTTAALADHHETSKRMNEGSGMEMQSASTDMQQYTAEQLIGKRIVNRNSEEIGVIESIVREKSTDDLSAVVSVGGFLGIGETEVSIPIADIRVWGNYLKVKAAESEEVLEARTLYKEPLYADVPSDQTIQLSEAETVATGGMSQMPDGFSQLDSDNSGYLSKSEAMQRAPLSERWQEIDKNGDNRLDKREFSAFEADTSDTSKQNTGGSGY